MLKIPEFPAFVKPSCIKSGCCFVEKMHKIGVLFSQKMHKIGVGTNRPPPTTEEAAEVSFNGIM